MKELWENLQRLRRDSGDTVAMGELVRLAHSAPTENIRDYIVKSVYQIAGVVIYPFALHQDKLGIAVRIVNRTAHLCALMFCCT